MLTRLLRKFVLTLVHLVVNLLVAVQNVFLGLFDNKHRLPNKLVTQEDILTLVKSLPNIRKELKHLVVLADTNNHSLSDLALIVIWSLIIGVPYISFYDITGHLKANDENLFLEIQKKKRGIPGCIKFSDKPNLNGYTNGNRSNSININIFSYNDGKPKIANCIQSIADSSRHDNICKEFTAQEFNEILSKAYPVIPDPEVILYTGPLCCTFGVLPWQIRLSEFICLSSYHSVQVNDYLNAIYKYNKCNQRFGK